MVYPLRGIVQAGRRAALDLHRRTAIYVGVLITLAVAAAASLVVSDQTLQAPVAVMALAVTAAVAERSSVSVARTMEISISVLPTLIAAVLFGPLAGGVVGAASMLGDPELMSQGSPERAPRLKWASYTSTRFLGGAAMGIAAQGVLNAVPSTLGGLITATLVGALIGELLEAGFSILTGVVRGRGVVATAALHKPLLAHLILIVAPVYAPVVALLAYMYLEFSPWTLALFLVPAIAAQRLYGLYQEQRRLADDLSIANETLERANLQFAGALIATLDARDRYTAGHSAAVAIYSRDIARRMELSEDIQELAYLCGLVHDIGKIGLSPGLLEKPGALTLDERRQMQEHSAIGERILAHVDEYSEIARIVRHHHERIDGQGYPDGLADDEIPLVARIIAVADAYNAMTSDRPYRDAMPSRVARLRLAQAVDSQFDTAAVAAFEAILAGAEEDYRIGERPDFKAFAERVYEDDSGSGLSAVAEVA